MCTSLGAPIAINRVSGVTPARASAARPTAIQWANSSCVTPETRLIAIGAPSDVHITRQLFAAFQAGRRGVPRLSVTTPIAEMVEALNAYRPEALIAYASIVGALADEQLEGRLHIEPNLISTTSEVLTDETEERIEAAWGQPPVNAYAATEAPGIAIGSHDHVGMHVFEGSVVL